MSNEVHHLDIVHDRLVTATFGLKEAVEVSLEMDSMGLHTIEPEIHDRLYDLHKESMELKRIINKKRLDARKARDKDE